MVEPNIPTEAMAESSGLTRAAMTHLRSRGLRLTPQRVLIMELLERSSGHIAPEDLYQQVLRRYPMINRSTVYRTLDLLEDLGLVRHGHVEDGWHPTSFTPTTVSGTQLIFWHLFESQSQLQLTWYDGGQYGSYMAMWYE